MIKLKVLAVDNFADCYMCLHGVQLKISRSNVQDIESGKWSCSTEMIMYKIQMHVHVICFGGYFDTN
jgi:hypothetical protein